MLSFIAIGEVVDIVLDTSLVFSFVVTVAEGAPDVMFGSSLVVLSTVVTFVRGVPGEPDVEPGTVVVVDLVVDGELAVEDSAVPDVVEFVVVVVTGLDGVLSIEVAVCASVFVEDDTEFPSELDIVFVVVFDGSVVVVSVVSVEMVCVADVSVSVVFPVDTDKLDTMVVPSSVVVSNSFVDDVVWVDTDVDALVDIPLEVVILIVEVSPFSVEFSTPVEISGVLLSALFVNRVGVTLSVVELSSVLL